MDRIEEEANRQQHVIEVQVPPAHIDNSIPEPQEDDSVSLILIGPLM